jgi:hypothetical protein
MKVGVVMTIAQKDRRKVYRSPSLHAFGSVASMTLGNKGSRPDCSTPAPPAISDTNMGQAGTDPSCGS